MSSPRLQPTAGLNREPRARGSCTIWRSAGHKHAATHILQAVCETIVSDRDIFTGLSYCTHILKVRMFVRTTNVRSLWPNERIFECSVYSFHPYHISTTMQWRVQDLTEGGRGRGR